MVENKYYFYITLIINCLQLHAAETESIQVHIPSHSQEKQKDRKKQSKMEHHKTKEGWYSFMLSYVTLSFLSFCLIPISINWTTERLN